MIDVVTSAWFIWSCLFALAMTSIWVWAVLHFNPAPPADQQIPMNPTVFQGVVPAAGSALATLGPLVPIILFEKTRSDPVSLSLLSAIAFLFLLNAVLGYWLRESLNALPRNANQQILLDSRLYISVRAAIIGIFVSIAVLICVFMLFSPYIRSGLEPDGPAPTETPPVTGTAPNPEASPEPSEPTPAPGQERETSTQTAPAPDDAAPDGGPEQAPEN